MSDSILIWKPLQRDSTGVDRWAGSAGGRAYFLIQYDAYLRETLGIRGSLPFDVFQLKRLDVPYTGSCIGIAETLDEAKAIAERAVSGLLRLATVDV